MFLPHIHVYRAIAILLVLSAHAEILFRPNSSDSLSIHLLATLASGGTITFVFISGYLFQHLSDRFNYRVYLSKKFQYVILPYLAVSTPILAHEFLFGYGIFEGRANLSWAELGVSLLHGIGTADHAFIPYWFIPTIALVYLCAPVFIAIDRRPRLYWWLVVLVPLASLLHRSWLYSNPIQNALHIIPVYLLGMLVSHYGQQALALYERYGGWLLLITGAFITIELALGRGGHIMSAPFSFDDGVVDWNYLQKAVLSVWMFGYIHHIYSRLTRWPWLHDSLYRVADISFGIFFLHIYLNLFILPRLFEFPELNWPGYVLVTPVYFLAAIAMTELAKRFTGGHSRRLIGC